MNRMETDLTQRADIFLHRTLEERAREYGGRLELDGEFDWGIPVGNERWELDDANHID